MEDLILRIERLLNSPVFIGVTGDFLARRLAESLCPQTSDIDEYERHLQSELSALTGFEGVTTITFKHQTGVVEIDMLFEGSSVVAVRRGGARQVGKSTDLTSLSTRELQVLQLLVDGLSNKEVARDLGLSRRTVEKHRANIHRKTKSNSLATLTRIWLAAS